MKYFITGIISALLGLVIIQLSTISEREFQIKELQTVISESTQSSGGYETDMPEIIQTGEQYMFPIAPDDYKYLTSPFGYRISPILKVERYHQGVDIASVWRAQVIAIADGVVTEHWPPPDGYFKGHSVYGGMLTIEHENGVKSLYAHLSNTRVNTGDRIEKGQVIGRVGGTGMSDGEHLHFQIMIDGAEVNPLLYVEP
jgi:murein DD-endopeptidase MepM/ murein hydrolase activator NlpD